MSKPNSHFIVRFIRHSILGVFLLIGMTGCADVMTYSRDAQYEGMTLYRKGDFANAAGAFRNSVRQNPRNYTSSYYLGASYEHIGQYQLAIASYKTARQTIKLSVEGRYDDEIQEKILVGLASSIAKCDQRDIETNAAHQEAESSPVAENWFVLAMIHANRGDADSAIDAYNRASLIEPNNFMISKSMGLYFEKMGQAQRAEAPLRRAYSLNNQDEQVTAALRRIGVIPGPALLEESQLARPPLPKGPIPEIPMPRGRTPQDSTVAAPRD